jgi:iron(III) transport system permease protein
VKRVLAGLVVLVTLALALSPAVAAFREGGLDTAVFSADPQLRSGELRALGTHVLLSGVAALTALVLGSAFAVLVVGTRSPLRRLLIAGAVLTIAVPQYIVAEALIDLLGPAGRVSRLVMPASQDEARLGVYRFAGYVYTAPAAGFVIGACLFPLVALAVASADARLDARIRESARLARGRVGAALVAARALGPAALGASLVVLALALTEFAVSQVLRVRTIGEDIFMRFAESGDVRGAAALGRLLVAIALVAGVLGAFFLARRRVASTAGLEGDVPRFMARPSRPLAGTLVGLLCLTPGLLAPLVSLGLQARAGNFAASLASAWAISRGDVIRTASAGAVGTTIALLLAAVVGRVLRAPGASRTVPLAVLASALAVPSPMVGLGLVALWNHHATAWVYDGMAVVVLGWLARFLPVSLLLARAAYAAVPPELEQAAALMGCGAARRFRSIVLPLAAPGLVASWLAFYVLAASEFAASQVVSAPGSPLLAPTVVNQIHYGQSATIAAACLILVATVSLPVFLALLVAFIGRRTWPSS